MSNRLSRALLTSVGALTLVSCQVVDNALIGIGGRPSPRPTASPTPTAQASPDDGTVVLPTSTPLPPPTTTSAELSYPAQHPVPFTAKGNTTYLQRWNGQAYENFYIKGVNLGIGLPGTQAGDLVASREHYARWFKRMGELGVNSLRIYTLHFPPFYEELARYNAAHADRPIYLFHGIWLDEENSANVFHTELHEATAGFEQNIREAIDVVHGKANITVRRGRAYGSYRSDISRWVAGWVIGREIIPDEIIKTNQLYSGETSFKGKHLNLPSGNPSEVWLAQRVDMLLDYERSRYQVDRPVSCSSWPTLDPLRHPTENPIETSEDVASIDMNQLDLFDAPAGYFATFHAYPYYPDFIVNEPSYQTERDSEGANNYIGYLKDLKRHYDKFPVVIAEYGTPSSWGNAHFSPSGMHHGGHDEVQQGHNDARLTRNLYESGMGGGMLFAWLDEWWKRTWIVDELTFPRERYRLWNNLTSPEENFGLIAFELGTPPWRTVKTAASGAVNKIEAAADAQYFHVKVHLKENYRPAERLLIGFDTYRDDLGDPVLPGGARSGHRHEFALDLDLPGNARLYVTQPYDLVGIWHGSLGPQQIFQSKAVEGAPWQPVRWQNDQSRTSADGSLSFPIKFYDIGILRIRQFSAAATSLDAVVVNDREIDVRLPWTLLNFVDPSTRSVMHDDRSTRGRESLISEGVAVSVNYRGQTLDSDGRYKWAPWSIVAPTTEREKPGALAMQQVWQSLPDKP
ncbi:MAG: hypothetical protein ACAI44_19975 [Candidatus Sericytochromatia bacterium]